MKNTYGKSLSVTLFGESHGEMIGAVIDGFTPGIKVNFDYIDKKLKERRPFGKISTGRCEKDEYKIVSGVFEGYTTGTPICILIENKDTKSKDYAALKDIPRPSHADYTAFCKYGGFADYRGGGHFSGRLTAALVAAGALIGSALLDKGIQIGTHISTLYGINDRGFEDYDADILKLNSSLYPALSDDAKAKMIAETEKAASEGDSVGGVLESVILGIPSGVGEPFFDSVESEIAHILFSIPAVKGVEFGAGFAIASMRGSEANDAFTVSGGKIATSTNHSGGINGGITNGMPILVRTAVKPTPSIYKPQKSVSISEMCEKDLIIEGRHDPAIIHRAKPVVDAALAIAVADMLLSRFGTDYLKDKNI